MRLIVYPAIDLRGGRVVRLRQGDPAAQTVFDEDPVAVAQRWVAEGAEWLHVVNLDGALGGTQEGAANLRSLSDIRAAVQVPIQFGGGLRTLDDVARALALGATRVVLGTAAIHAPQELAAALARFGPETVTVGLDARDGCVVTHGWQRSAELDLLSAAHDLWARGVRRLIHTDVARDGMLMGPNIASSVALAEASGLQVIASGGVAAPKDIAALARHVADGIEGVIVGQALYTGALTLSEAIAAGGGRC